MKMLDFREEQVCPLCSGHFSKAELKTEYHPVVVVLCPGCGKMLWRPGLDDTSRLFPFDPEADADGI